MANKTVSAAAAAAVLAVGVYAVLHSRAPALAPAAEAAAHAPGAGQRAWFSAQSAPQPQPQPQSGPGPGPALTSTSAALPAAQTLDAEVDGLIKQGTPQAALSAFMSIEACITFTDEGVLPMTDFPNPPPELSPAEKARKTAFCRSLSQRMRAARIEYLETAVKAGVPGSSIMLLAVGPFGDRSALDTRPDDPLVVAWKQRMLEQLSAQAAQGEIDALTTLWIGQRIGNSAIAKNSTQSYTYAVALQGIHELLGIPRNSKFGAFNDQALAVQRREVNPDQVAGAELAAGDIVAAFRGRLNRQEISASAHTPEQTTGR